MMELIRKILLSLFAILGVAWGLFLILVAGSANLFYAFFYWVFNKEWDFPIEKGDALHTGITCFIVSLLRVCFMENKANTYKQS